MTSQPGMPTSTLSLTTYPEPGIYKKPSRQIHTFFELRSIFKDMQIDIVEERQDRAQKDVVVSVTVRLKLFRQHPNDFHVYTLKTLHWCDRYVVSAPAYNKVYVHSVHSDTLLEKSLLTKGDEDVWRAP